MLKHDEHTSNRLLYGIDDMRLDDLPEVVEIEELSGLSRWGLDGYLSELIKGERRILLVARPLPPTECGRRVLAFLASWVVADEWQIINLATHPDFRRKGIGCSLMREGITRARARGAVCCFLEVRASNHAAQAFYRALGFTPCDRRSAYYSEPVEDAIIMRRDLV
jgi:ribosomal-protein-alanine N-acetyltransferase